MKINNKQRGSRGSQMISIRFLKTNIALFLVAFIVITIAAIMVLRSITDTVSEDYARLYSTNTSGALGTHLLREIAMVEKAARSTVVSDWLADESNQEKKAHALEEMLEIIDVLYSDNLYLGIHGSLNEYAIVLGNTVDDLNPHATLNPNYYDDAWYFECVSSADDYVLNVDIDKLYLRKSVWINYKVTSGDDVLGVICSGLEFSETAEALLAEYDNTKVRGLIIDENGVVQMDSISLGDDSFLRYEHFYQIRDEFGDPVFLEGLEKHLGGIDGFFSSNTSDVIELSGGPYSFATITPIAATKWSVVTFFNSSSLFHWQGLLPLFIVMPAMLVFVVIISGAVSYRVLFKPVELLIQSLAHISGVKDAPIYGTEREDEIGSLAKAIRDMLNKAHFDTLTGIYNRRYLDENLERIIRSLSRSGGIISILMIDIDFFKQYNDTYGHGCGDDCLRAIADTLNTSLMRSDDFVARYGGEEFVAVLPNTNESGARLIAKRMLENVRSLNITHGKSEAACCVTISIGAITGGATHSHIGSDYIKKADEALYASKHNGRNRFTCLSI